MLQHALKYNSKPGAFPKIRVSCIASPNGRVSHQSISLKPQFSVSPPPKNNPVIEYCAPRSFHIRAGRGCKVEEAVRGNRRTDDNHALEERAEGGKEGGGGRGEKRCGVLGQHF